MIVPTDYRIWNPFMVDFGGNSTDLSFKGEGDSTESATKFHIIHNVAGILLYTKFDF